FNALLHAHLADLMLAHCQEVDAAALSPVSGPALVRSYLAFHVMRKFPRWARWLPPHAPRLQPALAKDPP
ncbi:MAG: synthase, partial [Pseudomonadota bacterium]